MTMNMMNQNQTTQISTAKIPKWLKKDPIEMRSKISSGDTMNNQTTEISTESISSETRNILPEIRNPSYQFEADNSDEDIVQAHDDAGSTNQFIAE